MSAAEVAPIGPAPESAGGFEYGSSSPANLVESSREYVQIPPRNGADGYAYSGNPTIMFPLPATQAYLSVGETHMTSVIRMVDGIDSSGIPCGVHLGSCGLASVIRTLEVRQQGGGAPIRIENYNQILALLHKYYSKDWLHNVGRRYGYGTEPQRKSDHLQYPTQGKRMEYDLSVLGLMTQEFHIPMFAVGLEFVVHLENPVNALATDTVPAMGNLPNYFISQASLGVELITGTAALDELVLGSMAAGEPVNMPIRIWQIVPASLLTTESVTQKNFARYVEQMTLYLSYFQIEAAYSRWEVDIFGKFCNPGLVTAQIQVGATLIPPQPIRVDSTGDVTAMGTADLECQVHNAMFRNTHPIAAKFDGDAFSQAPPIAGVVTADSFFHVAVGLGSARDAMRNAGINTADPPQACIVRYSFGQALDKTLRIVQIIGSTGLVQILPQSFTLAE